MDERIRQFYEGTTSPSLFAADDSDIPLTHVKVFHKEYPRLPQVPLVEVDEKNGLEQLLEQRYSEREFSDAPLTLGELSALLSSCSIVDAGRNPEKRTYPSAGARFPIELYLIAFRTSGLDPGAYHYNMVRKTLELLWKQNLQQRAVELVSPYVSNPAAAIVFTSVIARSEVKYGLKSYPFSLIEAGHMAQNICLAAALHNIGICPVGGFVNDSIGKILDLTDGEIPLYVMAVGKKKE